MARKIKPLTDWTPDEIEKKRQELIRRASGLGRAITLKERDLWHQMNLSQRAR